MGSPYRSDRLRNLRIAYRNLIVVAPARDRKYWQTQRDINLPTA